MWENVFFRSTKPNISSKIVGWLVGVWDGKFQNLKKKSKRIFFSEINLKKGNPKFWPQSPTLINIIKVNILNIYIRINSVAALRNKIMV